MLRDERPVDDPHSPSSAIGNDDEVVVAWRDEGLASLHERPVDGLLDRDSTDGMEPAGEHGREALG